MRIFLMGEPGTPHMENLALDLKHNGFDVWPKNIEQPLAALEADVAILIEPARPIDYLFAGFLRGSGMTMWLFDSKANVGSPLNNETYFDEAYTLYEEVTIACRNLSEKETTTNG